MGAVPIGSEVVPFYGLYLESYKAIPKRNYLGAYGYALVHICNVERDKSRNLSVLQEEGVLLASLAPKFTKEVEINPDTIRRTSPTLNPNPNPPGTFYIGY